MNSPNQKDLVCSCVSHTFLSNREEQSAGSVSDVCGTMDLDPTPRNKTHRSSICREVPVFLNRFFRWNAPVVLRTRMRPQQSTRLRPSISKFAKRHSVGVSPHAAYRSICSAPLLSSCSQKVIGTTGMGLPDESVSDDGSRTQAIRGRFPEGRGTRMTAVAVLVRAACFASINSRMTSLRMGRLGLHVFRRPESSIRMPSPKRRMD